MTIYKNNKRALVTFINFPWKKKNPDQMKLDCLYQRRNLNSSQDGVSQKVEGVFNFMNRNRVFYELRNQENKKKKKAITC